MHSYTKLFMMVLQQLYLKGTLFGAVFTQMKTLMITIKFSTIKTTKQLHIIQFCLTKQLKFIPSVKTVKFTYLRAQVN